MTENDDLTQRRSFETYIIRKAWKDASFKQRLIDDPRGTFTAELQALDPNATLEGDVNIRVQTETPTEICLVLPMNPESFELAEADLDAVAGGGCDCKNKGCKKRSCVHIRCNLDLNPFGIAAGRTIEPL